MRDNPGLREQLEKEFAELRLAPAIKALAIEMAVRDASTQRIVSKQASEGGEECEAAEGDSLAVYVLKKLLADRLSATVAKANLSQDYAGMVLSEAYELTAKCVPGVFQDIRTSEGLDHRLEVYIDRARKRVRNDNYIQPVLLNFEPQAPAVQPEDVADDDYGEELATAILAIHGKHVLAQVQKRAREQDEAIGRGQDTTLRNVKWWMLKDIDKMSLEYIAELFHVSVASAKSGVDRGRRFFHLVEFEMRSPVATPHQEIEETQFAKVSDLYHANRREEARLLLDGLGGPDCRNGQYYRLLSWFLMDALKFKDAVEVLREGLVHENRPSVRACLQNNMGECYDRTGLNDASEASRWWWEASKSDPGAPTPIFNLLRAAVEQRDRAHCEWYLRRLGQLMTSDKLTDREKDQLAERLRHKDLSWMRGLSAWKRGLGRRITTRTQDPGGVNMFRDVRHLALIVALGVSLILGVLAHCGTALTAAGNSSRRMPDALRTIDPVERDLAREPMNLVDRMKRGERVDCSSEGGRGFLADRMGRSDVSSTNGARG